MKQELSEFTKEAIRRANEQIYNEDHGYIEHGGGGNIERSFEVCFKESEWEYLTELMDAEEKKCKAIIDKTYKYPSDTIASSQTREKYSNKINQLKALKAKILEEFF
jgi:hypothetical protein